MLERCEGIFPAGGEDLLVAVDCGREDLFGGGNPGFNGLGVGVEVREELAQVFRAPLGGGLFNGAGQVPGEEERRREGWGIFECLEAASGVVESYVLAVAIFDLPEKLRASRLRRRMAGERSTLPGELSPLPGQRSPLIGERWRRTGERLRRTGQRSPFTRKRSPLPGQRSPRTGERSPPDGERSRVTSKASPVTGKRPPPTVVTGSNLSETLLPLEFS